MQAFSSYFKCNNLFKNTMYNYEGKLNLVDYWEFHSSSHYLSSCSLILSHIGTQGYWCSSCSILCASRDPGLLGQGTGTFKATSWSPMNEPAQIYTTSFAGLDLIHCPGQDIGFSGHQLDWDLPYLTPSQSMSQNITTSSKMTLKMSTQCIATVKRVRQY